MHVTLLEGGHRILGLKDYMWKKKTYQSCVLEVLILIFEDQVQWQKFMV